jgi:hypothetical protein
MKAEREPTLPELRAEVALRRVEYLAALRAYHTPLGPHWTAETTQAHADPDAPGDEPASDPPLRSDDRRSHIQARVAVTGMYRSLFDLSVLGGGVTLSVGGDGDRSGQINLRLLD